MTKATISLLVNLVIALSFTARDDIPDGVRRVLVMVMVGFVLLSLIGLLGYSLTRKKAFAVTAMIGYGVFVPIGLIGVAGIVQMMKAHQVPQPAPRPSNA